MRIVSYNLRGGGKGNLHWSKIISDLDPDVFLVQETSDPRLHLPPLLHGDLHRNASWTALGILKWGSAVYVKGAPIRALDLRDFRGCVAGVEVDGSVFSISDGRPLRIFSVHAPKLGTYNKAVSQILDMIATNRGDGDLIVGGDFNLTVSPRAPGEKLTMPKEDSAILARIENEFGLVGAWQACHPGEALPQTLRWSGDKLAPFHCDGIFIPRQWGKNLQCQVVSGGEWDTISDHNPIVVDV